MPVATRASRRRPARAPIERILASLAVLVVALGLTSRCGVTYGAAEGAPPGLDAETIRVGFVVVAIARTQNLLGFVTQDQGDPRAQITALTSQINADGGIGGRRMVPVIREFEASTDSPQTEEQLCATFAQDDNVFAVVLIGQFQANARECYANRHILVLDITLVPQDQATYDRLAPYLWTPSYPSYDDFARGLLTALDGAGYFGGAKVGIIAADSPVNRAVYRDVVEPGLRARSAAGRVAWIDTLNIGTLGQSLGQAGIDFATAGVDHVMFLGGARLAAFFLTAVTAQGYSARYALTTFDNPGFLVDNPRTVPPATLRDAVGLGFQPAQDVPDSAYPLRSQPGEAECLRIFSGQGIGFANRATARTAMLYCDAVRLLRLGADAVRLTGAPLNATTWSTATQRLGTYNSANAFTAILEPGRYAPAAAYRLMAYDANCACFTYRGAHEPFRR